MHYESMIEEVADLLGGLEGKKIALVYHNDCDGMCSAYLLIKALSRKNSITHFGTRLGPEIVSSQLKEILKIDPDIVIGVDFAKNLDKSAKALSEKKVKTIYLEHHVPMDYIFPRETLYYNIYNEHPMPASAFVYDVVKKIDPGLSRYLWIGALGTILDYGATQRPDLIRKTFRDYDGLFEEKIVDNKTLMESTFARIGHMLNSGVNLFRTEGFEFPIDCLLAVETPYEFLEAKTPAIKKIKDHFDKVDGDLKRCLKDFMENYIEEGAVRYFQIHSEYSQKSALSTILSGDMPDKVVVVLQYEGERMKISARSQSGRYDLNSFIKEASQGLRGAGGGHKKAAGAAFHREDYKAFMERFILLINEDK